VNAVIYFNELARKFLLEGKIEQAQYLLETLFIDVKKQDDFKLASQDLHATVDPKNPRAQLVCVIRERERILLLI